jgi:hypothetical protein
MFLLSNIYSPKPIQSLSCFFVSPVAFTHRNKYSKSYSSVIVNCWQKYEQVRSYNHSWQKRMCDIIDVHSLYN